MNGGERPPSDPLREVTPEELVATYEALWTLAVRMYDCAEAGNWSALLEYESEYIAAVTELSRMRPLLQLSPEQAQRRMELLEQILDHNVQVKAHLERRREELGQLISRAQRQSALDSAYGTAPRPPCDAH